MMRVKQGGFTFLELLLVLSIVIILTAVVLPTGNRWMKKQSEQDALHAFVATIHHAQAYAMAHNSYTYIKSRDAGKSYSLIGSGDETYSTTDFPEGMHWVSSSNHMTGIYFDSKGHIVKSGTITIRTSTGDKKVKLQLHHGRVLVYDE